jgi:ankyrin
MTRPESGLRKGLFLIALLLIGLGAYHYWTTRLGGYLPLPWVDPPIIAAVKSCDAAAVSRVLARDPRAIWTRVKKTGATPLHWAARKCGPQVVKLLLDRGAPLTSRTRTGAMPLHWAAFWGRLETVKLLLDRGAWLEARTYGGAAPLHWAARRGDVALVKFLLSRGANKYVFDRTGRSPAAWARRAGRTAVARLLSAPARPPAVSSPRPAAKTTPPAKPGPPAKPKPGAGPQPMKIRPLAGRDLIRAVKAGNLGRIKQIIAQSPAAIEAVDTVEGGTPLHWAARLGKTEIVLYLIEHRADRLAKDKKGRTPFDWANQARHPDLAALLSTR